MPMLVNGRTYRRAGGPKCPCCQWWGMMHKPTASRPYKRAIKSAENRRWRKDFRQELSE
jgi:hypothetical protein